MVELSRYLGLKHCHGINQSPLEASVALGTITAGCSETGCVFSSPSMECYFFFVITIYSYIFFGFAGANELGFLFPFFSSRCIVRILLLFLLSCQMRGEHAANRSDSGGPGLPPAPVLYAFLRGMYAAFLVTLVKVG